MTVAVTGASGLLGRHVAAALRDAGRPVRAIDRVGGPDVLAVQLTDAGAALQALDGVEAVVHTAAIPRPVGHTATDVFDTNVIAAHNVVEAALMHGVARIVSASSFSVLGWPFNPQPIVPAYLPIDEQHPLAPQEAYALSKLVCEEIISAAVRRAPGLAAVSLRMPWIQTAASFAVDVVPRRADPAAATANLWGYIDAEDAADAFLAALDAPVDGHVAVYLSAADTFMEQDTATLVAGAFGTVELRAPLDGYASVLDTSAARQLLGVTPRRSWRDYPAQVGA